MVILLQTLAALHKEEIITDTRPELPLDKRLAVLCKETPALAARLPTLYRQQLHIPQLYDLLFQPDLLDIMLTLTGVPV